MKHLLIILFLGLSMTIDAQLEFKAEISKDAVMLNEPFILEYSVNQNFVDFKLAEFENFKLISGPSTAMQQSINMVNGEMTKKISVKYTYYIKAINPGTHSIKPAEIKIEDVYYYSNEIDVIVLDSEYINPNHKNNKDIKGTEKI